MVIACKYKLMPQLDNLHANEAIEYHDNDNDKPSKRKKWVRVAGKKCRAGRDIPYGSIVENYAEEHPFGRDRTPKLSRIVRHPIGRASFNLGERHSPSDCHTYGLSPGCG